MLVRHGVPATLYLATDFVERGRPFPDGGTPLSWSAIRDALTTGLVTLGSHTHTHALLDRVERRGRGRRARPLDRSDRASAAGVAAEHFAYPKALVGKPAVEALVRASFRSAAVAGTRAESLRAYRSVAPGAARRCSVPTACAFFEQKLAGGLRLEDDVRRLVNRVRYLGAST